MAGGLEDARKLNFHYCRVKEPRSGCRSHKEMLVPEAIEVLSLKDNFPLVTISHFSYLAMSVASADVWSLPTELLENIWCGSVDRWLEDEDERRTTCTGQLVHCIQAQQSMSLADNSSFLARSHSKSGTWSHEKVDL